MKFSDLTSNQRSIIAALAASSSLRTDALGRCCVPRLDGPGAANVLCSLRELGLIYSHQKPTSQTYADWKISQVGMAVFTARPDGDVVVRTAGEPVNTAGPAVERHDFVIQGPNGSTKLTGTSEEALTAAQHRATIEPGSEYKVFRLVAVAHMPVPQAVVTLL